MKKMKKDVGQVSVDTALAQVRTMALRSTTPNEVLLAAMETLSDAAQRIGHKEADHYKLSLKMLKEYEHWGPLNSLVIKLVGSDVAKKVNACVDTWKKALTKSQQMEPPQFHRQMETQQFQRQSFNNVPPKRGARVAALLGVRGTPEGVVQGHDSVIYASPLSTSWQGVRNYKNCLSNNENTL